MGFFFAIFWPVWQALVIYLFIYLFIIDRAREGARILHENFSLLPKNGHLPGNLEILILDALNVFLLSL